MIALQVHDKQTIKSVGRVRKSRATHLPKHSVRSQPALAREGDWRALTFFFVLGCVFSILPIVNAVLYARENKDYTFWQMVGQWVVAGEPLYADVRNGEPEYMYPPTAAVLLYAPLSHLSPVLFVAVLCLLNAASWAVAVWAASVLVTGQWARRSLFLSVGPGLMVAPYIWDVQLLGQTNLLLLALTLGSFLAMRGRRSHLASWLFGTAVALKAFPLSALAYFVARRQWLAVGSSIVSICALVWFFPGLVRGFERNTQELKQWASLMILDQSGNSMSGRSSIGFTRRNQSLVACSHRLLRHIDAGDRPEEPLYVNVVDLTPKAAQMIGHSICLLLGLVLLLACRFQFAPNLACEGLEVAMVCTLVPLCSPLAWTYFFCWLLPAWIAIGHWYNHSDLTAHARRVVSLGAAIATLLLVSAVSEQIDPTLQACGVTAMGSVALFLTLAYIRFSLPNTKFGPPIAIPGNQSGNALR
ncbi:glycosyltransferase family 87 protein [Schlesneria paludicola]|uniref:glycosyltransferase family 87 protein n=1 Tax=Schlesneria paludicola TaxID=360056 RepID=UPI00058ADF97|nr:glycosyltransferase family 87 protein [Schlesneria paludicola]